jgi:hypothetical protein
VPPRKLHRLRGPFRDLPIPIANLLLSLKRAGVAAGAALFASSEICEERTVKLPGVKFFNAGIGVSEGALGNTKELERAIEESSGSCAPDVNVTVICE